MSKWWDTEDIVDEGSIPGLKSVLLDPKCQSCVQHPPSLLRLSNIKVTGVVGRCSTGTTPLSAVEKPRAPFFSAALVCFIPRDEAWCVLTGLTEGCVSTTSAAVCLWNLLRNCVSRRCKYLFCRSEDGHQFDSWIIWIHHHWFDSACHPCPLRPARYLHCSKQEKVFFRRCAWIYRVTEVKIQFQSPDR